MRRRARGKTIPLVTDARPSLPLRHTLRDRTIVVSGATRGIGLAIAVRAAREGARLLLLGKTETAHPKLPGTLAEARALVEEAGGEALAVRCDVRSEEDVERAVASGVERFGSIDAVVNNASAIALTGTRDTPMKRFDLMHQVNVRGTFLLTQKCLPHLERSSNPHILTLSPPPSLDTRHFAPHLAYTLAKMGMSFCTLGWAEELRDKGIAANSLWPKTIIDTSAVRNLLGGEGVAKQGRTPGIVADAAIAILSRDARSFSGRFVIDEDILREENGEVDFEVYRAGSGGELLPDLFLPD